MNHQGISEALLKISLIKSHWNSVCDKQYIPTFYNQLRVGTLNHEEILKEVSMAVPQLDMQETFSNAHKNNLWFKKLITNLFPLGSNE